MGINWQEKIDSLEKSDIASMLESEGQQPLTGSDSSPGFFTDKDPRLCAGAPCSLQAWVEDNTPFAIDLVYRFEAYNSKATIDIYWKDQLDENGQYVLAKSFGPMVVTGRSQMTSAFAGQHEILGAEMFKKFAEWCKSIIDGESNE